LIERNGLGWATVKYHANDGWDIVPEMSVREDNEATDWMLQRDESLSDFDPTARPVKLPPNYSEKTRHAWTLYDQMSPPVEG
jgi:hypothetical protein